MATWVRNGTGTAPSVTDGDLVGTYELDNATAPADFDPDGVTSVQIAYTITGSGFGGDTWDDLRTARLTLNAAGTELALIDGTDNAGLGNVGSNTDETDSTITTGETAAAWEGAELNPPAAAAYTTFNQDKGKDGGVQTMSVLVVTITYTPLVVAMSIELSDYRIYSEGTQAGSAAFGDINRGKALAVATTYGIRFQLKATVLSGSVTPKLQRRVMTNATTGFGAWGDVTSSSTIVKASASTMTDDEVTTERMAGAGTFVAGRVDDVNGAITTATALAVGEDTEMVFSVELVDGDITSWRNAIQLRVIDVTLGAYDTETILPYLSKQGSLVDDFEGRGTSPADEDPITIVNTFFDNMGGAGTRSFEATDAHAGNFSVETSAANAILSQILCPEIWFRFYARAVSGTKTIQQDFVLFTDEPSSQFFDMGVRFDQATEVPYVAHGGTNVDLGTTAFPAGAWTRFEGYYAIEEEGATTGKVTGRYFDATDVESATPTEEQVIDPADTTPVPQGSRWIRATTAAELIALWDDLEINNTGWPGPLSPASAVYPPFPRRQLTTVRM